VGQRKPLKVVDRLYPVGVDLLPFEESLVSSGAMKFGSSVSAA